MYIDTGRSMPISPSKSRDLADENKKKIDGMEMVRNNCNSDTIIVYCLKYTEYSIHVYTPSVMDLKHI